MKDRNLEVFSHDVEVPEIVKGKSDLAFDTIREETTMKKERRYLHFFRSQAAAAAAVLILTGTVVAAAATMNLWGSGLLEELKATPEQQQELTEKGMAIAGTETDLKDLAVTDHGITVTPETVIVDERTAHISFQVKGVKDPNEFIFGGTVYLDSDEGKKSEDGSAYTSLNSESGFQGKDNEYIITARPWNGKSLLGKTIHIDLNNLEEADPVAKKDTVKVKGKWHFTITLPKKSSSRHIQIGKKVKGSDFTVDSIDISPISIQVDYSSRKAHHVRDDIADDRDVPPQFLGVVMKDGTRKSLASGGTSGYDDDDLTGKKAQDIFGFTEVIDPDQVKALLIIPQALEEEAPEPVEVPITK